VKPQLFFFCLSNPHFFTWEKIAVEAGYKPVKMAELCSVSLRTVQRHFQKHYALSVKDWVRSVRMEEAKRQILAGNSIKCVAIDLGFKQTSHFSRVFKTSFGVAPSFFLQDNVGARLPTRLYSARGPTGEQVSQ